MSKSEFINIRTEGGLLPIELLRRIAAGENKKVAFLTSHDYHLGGERLNEAVTRAWTLARGHWERFKQKREKVPSDDVGTTVTRSEWLLPLFKILEYGQLQRAKSHEIEGKTYPISHEAKEPVLIHLVGFGQNIDRRDTENKGGSQRMSPHSMVQELLNRSDAYTWAFLSNGLKFRILRDNVSMIRMAYVEFDLEAIFEHESFAEFFVFYLLAHQSRVEVTAEEIEEKRGKSKSDDEDSDESGAEGSVSVSKSCILERWYKTSIDDGVRVLDDLRNGVTSAIKRLGSGFLAQPKNRKLREMLQTNELSRTEFYHEILRIVYRLLFLMVAEDREMLFAPDASETNKAIYKKYYSISRLRDLARKRRGSRHVDLWRSLCLLFDWLDQGRDEMELPGIGSTLFRKEFIPTLSQFELNNDELLTAIRDLTFTKMNNVLQAIDYRNMGTEELGSVYESLLEMIPDIDASAQSFDLRATPGNDRKTTGSYYTPASLVNSLLDTALESVIQQAVDSHNTQQNREEALLNLKICDPACGSGHFLIGAGHRLAKRLATVRSGEDEPSVADIQHALRDIVGRCLYGVDINPMAVELCKISLWMDAMEPGRPLAFLDHHIQCGNSLLGATPALLKEGIPDAAFETIEGDDKSYAASFKKENKQYRQREEGHHQGSLLNDELTVWQKLGDIARLSRHIAEQGDERDKEESYYKMVKSPTYANMRLFPDAWCAAFVWKKCGQESGGFDYPITESVFRRIEKNPHDIAPWMREEIARLAKQYQFFHWHLAFPDVFTIDDDAPQGWKGGFDAVLGNPPWERIKLQEKEWFAERDPSIVRAPNKAVRERMIKELKKNDISLLQAFQDAVRGVKRGRLLMCESGRYPLCGRGDVNTYTIFAELNRQLLSPIGRVGCIVPSGIATDDTTKFFFQDLMQKRTLVSLYDFENRKKIFPAVDSRMKFSLLTMCSPNHPQIKGAKLAFFALDTKDLDENDRWFRLSTEDFALLNPNTRTSPVCRSVKDTELTKAIYRRVPVLIREAQNDQEEINPWGIKFSTMFHMSNDSRLFQTKEELEQSGFKLEGNHFVKSAERFLPLYEGKMIHHYNHRFGDYADLPPNSKSTKLPTIPEERLERPNYFPMPRYWVAEADVQQKLSSEPKYLMGWRDVTNTTNERTAIASIIPPIGVGHKFMLFHVNSDTIDAIYLQADMSSFVHDYVARQKMGGTSLSYFIVKQLPNLMAHIYSQPSPFLTRIHLSYSQFILPRVRELMYTSTELQAFEEDCGFNGEPFRWNEDRRFLLRCELDAAFFGLYLGFGEWSAATEHEETPQQRAELERYFPTPRDAVEYIMETFPIVKRKDLTKYETYRTKETILSIYDDMVTAIRTNTDYQTRLTPPPADDSLRHGYETTPPRRKTRDSVDTSRLIDVWAEFSEGRSADYVIACAKTNTEFIKAVQSSGIKAPAVGINKALLNARKQGLLSGIKTTLFFHPEEESKFYEFASEWSLVALKNELQSQIDEAVSLDTILCNPEYAKRFDDLAVQISSKISSLDYRWMALRLRKRSTIPKSRESESRPNTLPGLEDAVAFSSTYSIQLAQEFYYVKDTPDYNKQRDIHLEVSNGDIIPSWLPIQRSQTNFSITTIAHDVYENEYYRTPLNFHISD